MKKIWVVILLMILTSSVGIIVTTYFVEDMYKVETTLEITQTLNGKNKINTKDLSEIAKSQLVLSELIRSLKLDISTKELINRIYVSYSKDSDIIKIEIFDTSPDRAVIIANKTASIMIKDLSNIMNVDNIYVIEKAAEPEHPVSPSLLKNVFTAAVIGCMIGVLLIYLKIGKSKRCE